MFEKMNTDQRADSEVDLLHLVYAYIGDEI